MKDSGHAPSRFAKWLSAIFVLALVMGPGPGVYLINPRTQEEASWFGVPVLYVWAVFWFAVMAATVAIAFKTVWRVDENEGGRRA